MQKQNYLICIFLLTLPVHAQAFILGVSGTNQKFLLLRVGEEVQYHPCGEVAFPADGTAMEPKEIISACKKAELKNVQIDVPVTPTFTRASAAFERSLAGFYGVPTRFFELDAQRDTLAELAIRIETAYRTQSTAPLDERFIGNSEAFDALLLARDEVLEHLDSAKARTLNGESDVDKRISYAAIASLTETYSDGFQVYRIIDPLKDMDNSCRQKFGWGWIPASLDHLIDTAMLTDNFTALVRFTRGELKIPAGKKTPSVLTWYDVYEVEDESLKNPRQLEYLFNFDLDPAAIAWSLENGTKVTAAFAALGNRYTPSQVPGYGKIFHEVRKPASRLAFCTRSVSSLFPKEVSPGEVNRNFIEKLFNVSLPRLYRKVAGCPVLDNDLSPILLDPKRSMSVEEFDKNFKSHLVLHLGKWNGEK